MSRVLHIYGNWKMNHLRTDVTRFFSEINDSAIALNCKQGICPQDIHLSMIIDEATKKGISVGAQNSSHQNAGAFTGDTSPKALKDLGVTFTLVGHSERRSIFNENHRILNLKTKKALESNLDIVFCIGETLDQRESGKTFDILKEQLIEGLKGITKADLSKIILAYEPVWAIGTGKVATPEQADETHRFIREFVSSELKFSKEQVVILYGGSVKPSNASGLFEMPNIDGALVGGASLKACDYLELCKIAHGLSQ
jgi:triosephosphate isomerase (TIM)